MMLEWSQTKVVGAYQSLLVLGDAVVIHTAFITNGDGHLASAGLRIPKEEAAVDAAAQEVLRRVAWNGAVVPGKEIQIVRRRGHNVIAGHPSAVAITWILHLSPVPLRIVSQ